MYPCKFWENKESLERYQGLMNQIEYLECRSTDNFIEMNYIVVNRKQSIVSVKYRACESIKIDLTAIEENLGREHQSIMIPEVKLTFTYKGGVLCRFFN